MFDQHEIAILRRMATGAVPGGDSPACAMRLDTSTSDHASSAPSRAYTSATVAWTACAPILRRRAFRGTAAKNQSARVRAPAFAGVTTGSGGTRNALGTAPGALQRPQRHLYHLRPLGCTVTPPLRETLSHIERAWRLTRRKGGLGRGVRWGVRRPPKRSGTIRRVQRRPAGAMQRYVMFP